MSSGVPVSSQPAPPVEPPSIPTGARWSGRALERALRIVPPSDGITKVMKISAVLVASARLGLLGKSYCRDRHQPARGHLPLGYSRRLDSGSEPADPAAPLQSCGNPLRQTLFPVYFGVLVWLGRYFREARLRALLPLRS